MKSMIRFDESTMPVIENMKIESPPKKRPLLGSCSM